MLEVGHRPHAAHHWRPPDVERPGSKLVEAPSSPVRSQFHTQVVNRKLGPVDFCPPFITLLIVKVISLLEQFLSCQYLPDG